MCTRVASRSCVVALSALLAMGACSAHEQPKPSAPSQPQVETKRAPGPLPVLTPNGVVSAKPGSPAGEATPTSPARKPSAAGESCGGIAGMQCAEKLYCAFAPEANCGAADRTGSCKPIPELCTMQFAAVCGCDDKTYSNACVAARSAVSVAHEGACEKDGQAPIAEGKPCGSRGVSGQCEAGLYCAFGPHCGETDRGGKCEKKPELCPHLVQPVCGCDGKTYNNGCEAARAAVSVAAHGRCTAR